MLAASTSISSRLCSSSYLTVTFVVLDPLSQYGIRVSRLDVCSPIQSDFARSRVAGTLNAACTCIHTLRSVLLFWTKRFHTSSSSSSSSSYPSLTSAVSHPLFSLSFIFLFGLYTETSPAPGCCRRRLSPTSVCLLQCRVRRCPDGPEKRKRRQRKKRKRKRKRRKGLQKECPDSPWSMASRC